MILSNNDVLIECFSPAQKSLCILVNQYLEIQELSTSFKIKDTHRFRSSKIESLWNYSHNEFSKKITTEILAVINSGQPRVIFFQGGSIPVYSRNKSSWQCGFYPISINIRNQEIQTVLVRLEDVSHLINLNGDTLACSKQGKKQLLKANSSRFSVIKELEAAHKALKLEEERFRLLVENIEDYAIFLLDKKGNVKTWNRGAELIKQYKADEIIGKHFSIFYPDDAQKINRAEQELSMAKKNGRYEEEGWRVKKDGTLFWANVIITAIYDINGELVGFGKVTRDLSERKKIEQLKNEFISVVSHELRTPLTSIRGALSLLEQGAISDFSLKNKGLLHIANNNCERLARLIDDVLDIEKIKDGYLAFNYEKYNLKLLVNEAISLNEAYAKKFDIALVSTDLLDVDVLVDADRLIQVLTNLISNAVKFSPPGSEVVFTMNLEKDHVSVCITDHGPGIPAEFKEKIFQRFSQADATNSRKKGGTGLGLAISKAIIENLDGILNYHCDDHQGTTFYFTLPVLK